MLRSTLTTPKIRSARHPLRVFGLFAIGIVVPSCFLSYLGLRSLHMENLQERQQTEQRYAAVADVLQRKISDLVTNVVQDVHHNLSEPALRRNNATARGSYLLSVSNVGGAPVQAFFIFDGQGRVLFPSVGPTDGKIFPSAVTAMDWGPLTEEVRRLERLEFVDQNLPAAIAGYETLLTHAPEPRLEIALLKNIASSDRKLKRWKDAEARYLDLIHRFDAAPDPVGYPIGILARQLLAGVYDEAGESERALDTRLELAQGLFEGRWPTTARQQELFLSELAPVISKGLVGDAPGMSEARSRWSRLQGLGQRLILAQSSATRFLQTRWPELLKRVQARGWATEGGVLQDPAENSLIVVDPVDTGRQGRGFAIAVLQAGPFFQALQRAASDFTQSSGLQIEWSDPTAVHAPPLAHFSALMRPYLPRAVTTLDPPLQFRLLENASDPQEVLRRRRQSVYFGMIGLSLLVIIGGLAAMLQAIRRESEVAALKADFVATVSHELRTPLSAISYIGERLSLGRYGSPEQVKRFYDMLGEETGRLREMVDGILDFSKLMDGGQGQAVELHDLGASAVEALDRFQGKASSRGFAVHLERPDAPLRVEMNRAAVRQAILNLLDNALKYSPQSREIRLRVLTRDQFAVVEVQDFGLGIAPAEQKKIFERFYRVEQSAQTTGERGVGLGLAMVQQIMDNHGGRVEVASGVGQGSTFSLWFRKADE